MNRFLKLFGNGFRARPKSQQKAAPQARLALEALEERWMPSAVRETNGFALATLWFLILLCNPAWTYAQSYPLYVTDGKSLSKIDLTTLTTTKVGDFSSTLATRQLQLFYDWHHHFLYAFDAGNFWTIDKDTAQVYGPNPIPEVLDTSGHPVSQFFVAALCYWNNTFYVIGSGSKTGLSLITINPNGWEVLGVEDYEIFAFRMTCATFDDWNGAILAAGFTPTHAHFLPPDLIAFQATPVNLGPPVTQASFHDYIRGPNDVAYYTGMSVDPDSSDLFIGGGNVFDRIKRGTQGVVQQYEVPGTNAIGFAFGAPTPIATQITLTVPSSIVQGDRTHFATVAVTASTGSITSGTVQLTFSGFGTFTHHLPADGTTSYTLYSLPVGTYTLQASYPSQGGFAASRSVVQTLQVTSH